MYLEQTPGIFNILHDFDTSKITDDLPDGLFILEKGTLEHVISKEKLSNERVLRLIKEHFPDEKLVRLAEHVLLYERVFVVIAEKDAESMVEMHYHLINAFSPIGHVILVLDFSNRVGDSTKNISLVSTRNSDDYVRYVKRLFTFKDEDSRVFIEQHNGQLFKKVVMGDSVTFYKLIDGEYVVVEKETVPVWNA